MVIIRKKAGSPYSSSPCPLFLIRDFPVYAPRLHHAIGVPPPLAPSQSRGRGAPRNREHRHLGRFLWSSHLPMPPFVHVLANTPFKAPDQRSAGSDWKAMCVFCVWPCSVVSPTEDHPTTTACWWLVFTSSETGMIIRQVKADGRRRVPGAGGTTLRPPSSLTRWVSLSARVAVKGLMGGIYLRIGGRGCLYAFLLENFSNPEILQQSCLGFVTRSRLRNEKAEVFSPTSQIAKNSKDQKVKVRCVHTRRNNHRN